MDYLHHQKSFLSKIITQLSGIGKKLADAVFNEICLAMLYKQEFPLERKCVLRHLYSLIVGHGMIE